ncbi:MAG TPA: hypothetical protein VGL74_02775, partial [Terriglobales bacterium]
MSEEEPVCGAWQRFVQAIIILFLALTAALLGHYLLPGSGKLQQQVRQLSQQVEELQQQQAMPALVLNR